METVQDLVNEVLEEGAFDASATAVLRWLNRRHRTMVVRSRCWRKSMNIGSTVAGQDTYLLSDFTSQQRLVAADLVTVGWPDTVPYQLMGAADVNAFTRGFLLVDSAGAFMEPAVLDTGLQYGTAIRLTPTPSEDGLVILVTGAWSPKDLELEDVLVVPPHYFDAIVAGALATGLSRNPGDWRPDLADRHEQTFQQACLELRRETDRALRTTPPQIRVVGLNA